MNLLDELVTARGRVIGFGRVKIPKMPSLGFDLEIPLLSFIVTEAERGREYVSTCIHLLIDGYGTSWEHAVGDMISNIWGFLLRNKERRSDTWYNLFELSKANAINGPLWDKYHAMQWHLAEMGEPDQYTELVDKITSLQNRVREMEATLDNMADGIDSRNWRLLDGIRDSLVVHYKKVERDGFIAA
jgi:hypothetical protein